MNNSQHLLNENVNLFTLDVQSLYPSIKPALALDAIREALATDITTDTKIKTAIKEFVELSFDNSYVTYNDECFKSKIGIPTGGSLSRQIADIFLHWILFVKIIPTLNTIQAIRFWNRFIDDCLGIWRGTKRSFDNFLKQLNEETMKYGIYFPVQEVQFGKSVSFLDLNVFLDDENTIQFSGYSKPTDAKRYLNPGSFHPDSVFNSIPFSQMLRVLRNNSTQENKTRELNDCVKHFTNSGYNTEKLQTIKQKVINKSTVGTTTTDERDTLVLPVHYFAGISELKKVLHSLNDEFCSLIGDTRIMVAMKKGASVGNAVVRNKQLSIVEPTSNTQRCNGPGCMQCPLSNEETHLVINGKPLHIPRHLNCRSKNVIYLWVCKICEKMEAYFGRTTQKSQNRTSGHRGCFRDEGKWDKSALSMHAKEVHGDEFSLDNFVISVVKKVSPQRLRREEFKFIEKYRTIPLGLNRYKV